MGMKTRIANDNYLLKEASKKLIDALKEKGVDEDIIFDIHVGFEEALRNAMVHGNKMDPRKKVTVKTEVNTSIVVICVEDEGEGFDPETLPDPTLDENLLKEGGRGVYLIRHLMDEVRYENGGRRVIMKKYLGGKHL
jgi:serine/threonine-protein kinase RsbW